MRRLTQCILALCLLLLPVSAWADITLVGKQGCSFQGTTTPQVITFNLTGGSDSTPQVGDLVVVAYGLSANGDITLIIDNPSGTDYTQFGTEQFADDTEDANLRVAYRVMPDPTEADVTLSTTVGGGTGDVTRAGGCEIVVLRGVHATPLEQAVQAGTAINTILVDPGSITPTTAGTWILVFGAGASTNTSGNFASSDLTDFRENNADDGHAFSIGGGHLEWTSGAFAPATWTWSGSDSTNYSYAWKMIALAPASFGGGTAIQSTGAAALFILQGH